MIYVIFKKVGMVNAFLFSDVKDMSVTINNCFRGFFGRTRNASTKSHASEFLR